ncbi:Maf family protein [Desulfoluna butyratoxydans]|uniref:dTTP/UTP pyrophosphatase n=1 Tax=Desulfoluna butyratoxydans TaxID=231438 RepID=A0A4U8YV99_9BACT|nr:Maf family protein [Desulfoluna butyratoxydans]VFQ47369.1 maf: septum formation protein maf [Desulfoluna butyratoxydans]
MKENQHIDTQRLVLASQSPRRKDLLEEAGVLIDILPSCADEVLPEGVAPSGCAMALARLKARDVAETHPERWVLGADTIVVVDDTILGKPDSADDARRMLSLLSGRSHQVCTGFCLINKALEREICDVVITEVTFKALSEAEISWYIGTDEPFDKAGAYGIQGKGASLVREIKGSYTNVVGLPVCEVVEHLKDIDLVEFR